MGIDFFEAGIAAATLRYGGSRLRFATDESSLHLEAGPNDLLTCIEVLEHLPAGKALLQSICRASCRYVILMFPTGRMRKYEIAVGHLRNFQRGKMEGFVSHAGFAEQNISYADFLFYFPLYREFYNVMDAGRGRFASRPFGFLQKAMGVFLFGIFRYLSMRRVGDQYCGLFERW